MLRVAPSPNHRELLPTTVLRPTDCAVRPGVLHLDDELRVLAANDSATRWLERIDEPGRVTDGLPEAVAAHVLDAQLRHDDGVRLPHQRITASGDAWLRIDISALSTSPRTWAVVIEPAHTSDIVPVLAHRYALTAREHDVLALLVRGLSDRAIADTLVVSIHTARDHVRNVKAKIGVRTRGDLHGLLWPSPPTNRTVA